MKFLLAIALISFSTITFAGNYACSASVVNYELNNVQKKTIELEDAGTHRAGNVSIAPYVFTVIVKNGFMFLDIHVEDIARLGASANMAEPQGPRAATISYAYDVNTYAGISCR